MTRDNWVHLESRTRSVSVAVEPIDVVTGRIPTDGPALTLLGVDGSFDTNRRGWHVATDLGDDAAPFEIEVGRHSRYLPQRLTVTEEDYDPPLELTVRLLPTAAYPFPVGATLIRGSVATAHSDPGQDAQPLEGADVVLVGPEEDETDDESDDNGLRGHARTDERGEYVLYVAGITGEDVLEAYPEDPQAEDGPVVHVDGVKPHVEATHPNTGETIEVEAVIPEGKTTTLDFEF